MLAALSLLLTACLEVEEERWTFDLSAGTGAIQFKDIRAPSAAPETGLAGLVVEYLLGTTLEKEHPGWTQVEKALLETDGRLDGQVRFSFAQPADAGLYRHDKKSPWIWCASDRKARILRTNGEDISAVLPGCVAWSRKEKRLEVSLAGAQVDRDSQGDSDDEAVSLLPTWKRWQEDGAPSEIHLWPPYVEAMERRKAEAARAPGESP